MLWNSLYKLSHIDNISVSGYNKQVEIVFLFFIQGHLKHKSD